MDGPESPSPRGTRVSGATGAERPGLWRSAARKRKGGSEDGVGRIANEGAERERGERDRKETEFTRGTRVDEPAPGRTRTKGRALKGFPPPGCSTTPGRSNRPLLYRRCEREDVDGGSATHWSGVAPRTFLTSCHHCNIR